MFYLEKGKRYVRIRKNHRNYQEEMRRRRSIRNVIALAVLVLAVGLSIVLGLPSLVASTAQEWYSSRQEKVSKDTQTSKDTKTPAVGEPEAKEPVEEEEEVIEPATLVFTGDVELSTYVQSNFDNAGIDGVTTQALRRELKRADIAVINNEFCFSERGTPSKKQYTFRVAPAYVTILNQIGIDVAGLANNHSLDYGQDALLDTIQVLNDAGIENTGAGNSMDEAARLVIKEVNGKKFGFLACSRVIPYSSWDVRNAQPGLFTCYDPTELVARTQSAKSQCDYLFVLIHWGIEQATKLEAYQTQIGQAVIDAGADAVIGAHPHILQGIEYHSGKPIFYSLGNFIFNQDISQTALVKVVVDEEKGVSYSLLPAYAQGATTRLATETEGAGYDKTEEIYNTLRGLSPTVSIDEQGNVTETAPTEEQP